MDLIILSVGILAAIGAGLALILYFVSRKFKVYEDPKIDEIAALLPGANCGGCGFAGCRNFAEFIVKNGGLNGKMCPPGGAATNDAIAALMGGEAQATVPTKIVLCCNGTCENAPSKIKYDSIASCAYANMVTASECGCSYGCLGCGDCVKVCGFDAIAIDVATGMPQISDKCVQCGACITACPRNLLTKVPQTEQGIVWVACKNKEKGVEAKKNCTVACIGCMKCVKSCQYEAVTVADSLATINEKCIACKTCAEGCPTKAIHIYPIA
ncbi:MAG: RnfABCDGE type electron transport complex subunit B [Bacteroidales bacterium]|jgi:Na+-translocating ferredoxin:NAD+ oxidoreductase RNF subunit RnfB|nr:RnfABCDGE type electron transport complex subunit B [Bacteroidales bacterium]